MLFMPCWLIEYQNVLFFLMVKFGIGYKYPWLKQYHLVCCLLSYTSRVTALSHISTTSGVGGKQKQKQKNPRPAKPVCLVSPTCVKSWRRVSFMCLEPLIFGDMLGLGGLSCSCVSTVRGRSVGGSSRRVSSCSEQRHWAVGWATCQHT